jgi:hypothetical protein
MDGIAEELSELPGWSPLILCMMYESQKEDSFWKPYFGKHILSNIKTNQICF